MYPARLCAVTPISSAPASTMPWMELVADISGVCRVAGTFPMTSMPTSSARTKMVRSVTSSVDIGGLLNQSRVHDRSGKRDDHAGLDLVLEVQGQHAVGHHVQEQGGDVPRVGVR